MDSDTSLRWSSEKDRLTISSADGLAGRNKLQAHNRAEAVTAIIILFGVNISTLIAIPK